MKKRWHKERGALHRAQHHPVVLAVLAMGGAFFLALIFLIAKAAAIGISAHVSGHTWLPVEMPGGLGPGRPGKLIKTKKLKMPAPGGPAFECKGYEKRQQVDNFLNVKDSWRPAFGLGCADPVKMGGYLAATWNISQRPVTLVNIGANKGELTPFVPLLLVPIAMCIGGKAKAAAVGLGMTFHNSSRPSGQGGCRECYGAKDESDQ